MNASLTPREYEVARLFALGRTWPEIEDELGISKRTVQNHRNAATSKVGGGSMVDVWRAVGWLRPPTDLELAEKRVEWASVALAEAQRAADQLRASSDNPPTRDAKRAVGRVDLNSAPSILRRVG